jgi:hypothetical protein
MPQEYIANFLTTGLIKIFIALEQDAESSYT